MSHNNILEPIPANLNDYLLKYNTTVLNDEVPAAPDGSTNVTWQSDQFGNISAYSTSSGSTAPANLNLVATNAEGDFEQATDLTIASESGNRIGVLSSTADVSSSVFGIAENVNSAGSVAAISSQSLGSALPAFVVNCINASGIDTGDSLFAAYTDGTVRTFYNFLDDGHGNIVINGPTNGLVIGQGFTTPEASIELPSSNGTLAAIRIKPASALLATPIDGAFEYDGTHLYFTIGTTRHTVTLV